MGDADEDEDDDDDDDEEEEDDDAGEDDGGEGGVFDCTTHLELLCFRMPRTDPSRQNGRYFRGK